MTAKKARVGRHVQGLVRFLTAWAWREEIELA